MDDSGQYRPPKRGKRFFRLAGMTASVAGKYASLRLRSVFTSNQKKEEVEANANKDIGERIARTLGELKGAAMKIGQMASIGSDILPKEISNALKVLQKGAPPVPFETIEKMIESELGSPPELLFNSFEREPFASASIGQVHRAVCDDGRDVVVKVQYPGVDNCVDSDLSHLKVALRASGLLKLNRKALNALFDELKTHLHRELDYCNEADNVRLFRDHHAQHDFVHVPDVVGERSAQRVLTLTYLGGDDIGSLDDAGYSQEIRNQIGENMYRLTLSQIFELGAIHADPNPANFAFRPDGSIVLYDFGCVKHLQAEIVDAISQTIRASIAEDYDDVHDALGRLGVLNPKGPVVEHEYYKMWRDIILQPFMTTEPFDYASSDTHEKVLQKAPTVMKRMDSFQPAVEIVFVNRTVGGHYGNLKRIRSRAHFLDVVGEYVSLPPWTRSAP